MKSKFLAERTVKDGFVSSFCNRHLNFTVKYYRKGKGGEPSSFPPILLAKPGKLMQESCAGQIPTSGGTAPN